MKILARGLNMMNLINGIKINTVKSGPQLLTPNLFHPCLLVHGHWTVELDQGHFDMKFIYNPNRLGWTLDYLDGARRSADRLLRTRLLWW